MVRFTDAQADPHNAARLRRFLEDGHHGDHGLDGGSRPIGAPNPQRLWPEARSIIVLGMNYGPGPRSAGDPGAQGSRRDLGLCARRRLSRCGEEEAQGAGRPHLPNLPGRSESLCRYRAGDGKAAGAKGRPGLAGQAHQSCIARVRLLAVSGLHLHHPGIAAGRAGRAIIAAIAVPAWTSAPPMPFPRPIGWMRGAAFPISPSSIRALSRANSARRWATASMAATIAWRCAPGTNSRKAASEMKLHGARGTESAALGRACRLDDAGFPRPVPQIAGQAHRPRPVPAQCDDRHRQQRRCRSGGRQHRSAAGRSSPLVRGAAVWALSQLLPRRRFGALARDHAAARSRRQRCAREWIRA